MCGIVACLGIKDLTKAVELLAHRGIRHEIAQTPQGTVAHVRLPIVGVGPLNDQPIHEGPWTIAFVGELLDFREKDPTAECDLADVVRSWVNFGPHGFTDRDGFWSIVALDQRTGYLHILCDYLAQKPMYFRRDAKAAASEIRCIASLAPVTIDEVYMSAAIKWGYCPDVRRTPFNEVKRVLPGEHVVIKPTGEVQADIVDPLVPDACDAFTLKSRIEAAVKRRVTASDVPVACLVSGGLDSAIVYTLAKRYGSVQPYYVAPPESQTTMFDSGELDAVKRVVGDGKLVQCKWSEVTIEKGIKYMQEPIDLGSLIPQIALSDAIAESGREWVCLTGDGADEFFGGYGRSDRFDSQGSDVYHELVAWHLPRLDRVMMRNQIEVRSPFLARSTAAAAMGITRADRTGKRILKKLFSNDLPHGIADQPKVPLRTTEVKQNREVWSKKLAWTFRRQMWTQQ